MSASRIFDRFAGLLDVLWSGIPDGGLFKRTGSTVTAVTGSGIVNVQNGVYQTPIDPSTIGGAPIGSIIDFAGNVEPSGWLFCFGQVIPRTGIYAPLFGVIGVTYGAGDGTTTFQLPDFRGVVTAGKEDMGGAAANRLQVTQSCSMTSGSTTLTIQNYVPMVAGMLIYGPNIPAGTTIVSFPTATTLVMSAPATATLSSVLVRFAFGDTQSLGARMGVISHLLSTTQIPSHVHSYYWWDHTHSSLFPQLINASGIAAGANYNWTNNYQGTTTVAQGGISGNHDTSGAGGSNAHINVQPTAIVNKIIKYTLTPAVSPPSPGTGDVVGPSNSIDGEVAVFQGTSGKFIRRGSLPAVRFPRGHIGGLRISNNVNDLVNDIDIQDGECRSTGNNEDIFLPTGMTKRLDAPWAPGTGQGGLDLGSVANGSYHVFVIKRIDTGAVDILFASSAVDPFLPTGYGHCRRIGSILRRNGTIDGFYQDGDYFWKNQPETDPAAAPYFATANVAAMIILSTVPTGIKGYLMFNILAYGGTAGGTVAVTSPYVPDSNVGAPVHPYGPYAPTSLYANSGYPVMFDTSARVRIKTGATGAQIYLGGIFGWIDRRGRND